MKNKSCGSCKYFVKLKDWALCEYFDWRVRADTKGKCKKRSGIKYRRIQKHKEFLCPSTD